MSGKEDQEVQVARIPNEVDAIEQTAGIVHFIPHYGEARSGATTFRGMVEMELEIAEYQRFVRKCKVCRAAGSHTVRNGTLRSVLHREVVRSVAQAAASG